QRLLLGLRDDQQRVVLAPRADQLDRCLGRGRVESGRVEHAERATLCVGRKRATKRRLPRLAVDLADEVAVVRRERHAAAGPVRRARPARAGPAGALLAPRLRAAARYEAAALAAARSRARLVLLRPNGLVDEVRLNLDGEHALFERDALRGAEHWSLRRGHGR